MLLNSLPNEILVKIFDYIDYFEHLIDLSKVCLRWETLILHRLSKVKYLSVESLSLDRTAQSVAFLNHSADLDGLDLNRLVPNLKIVDFSITKFSLYPTREVAPMELDEIMPIVNRTPSIKGIIVFRCKLNAFSPIESQPMVQLKNIEMFACKCLNKFNTIHNHLSDKITQIYCESVEHFKVSISRLAKHFTNLTKLNINIRAYSVSEIYGGPIFPNLKILEFSSESYEFANADIYPGYHFMDFCPALESAYFKTKTTIYFTLINEPIKNYNLKDLVISHDPLENRQKWSSIKKLLSKFPNLENLAIRGSNIITDEHIQELVTLSPKIKLMDFRGSKHVTVKSADYLEKFCSQSGRSIIIYYNCVEEEPLDWPKNSISKENVVCGFDFMKHCFFNSFETLPCFLDT